MATNSATPGPSEDALTRDVRTLRARPFAGALIALVILSALALSLVLRQYEDAKDDAAGELRARAILAATVFDTYFAGQLAELSAMAASPSVVAGNAKLMTEYFARFRPGREGTFTAGVGWIDLEGRQRATSDPSGPIPISLADRTYFRAVVSTRKPFVSEAIVAQTTKRRLVVMSVPTRDETGRVTGVLAGGIVLEQSPTDARASDLGFAGLRIIDRNGQQLTRRDLARPENGELVEELRKAKEGVIVDTRGLDGSRGRVVAFASSPVPGWTAVLDESASTVFGDARRTLVLEAVLVVAAAAIVLALIAWALRRARRDLRASSARVGRWAELTRSLNDAVDVGGIADILASALASEFPGAQVIVALERPESGKTILARGGPVAGIDEEVALSLVELITGRERSVALETQAEVRDETVLRGASGRSVGSLYSVSLLDRSRKPIGAAVLLFDRERALRRHELALLQAHADQAAQAIARVRRHEQAHDAAVLLQRSLLPAKLPETEGVEIAGLYRAGVANTQVGGDWYDIVRRPDGIVHLTVGDVAGRGIEAAILMGQLRNAFRAYALDHESPGAIVRRLDRHVQDDGMATMVCVSYDPYTRELAYASAGHVPPILVDPAAKTVTLLERSSSGPLGWHSPKTGDEEPLGVAPGSTLALYTDGLVERRGSDIDTGIERLGAAILESLSAELGGAVDALVDRMVDDRLGDDVALLLLRLGEAPATLRIELPADPLRVRELRRRVRTWLTRRGLDESVREDAVLALSEACNNAIEHGYRDVPGTIRVQMTHRGDALEIRVADDGSWREPVQDSTRGRGILIMQGLMDAAEIVQGANGTEVVLLQRL